MRAKTSRYVRFARLAYNLAQEVLPRYSHPKSPHHFTFPQLAACVFLMFYLDLSYRDMEEWLLASEQVCAVLELPRVPNYSTLERTFKKLQRDHYDRLKDRLLAGWVEPETVMAVDSTGLIPSQASVYYQTRRGRPYREYVKAAYAVGTQSQLILGWRAGSLHTRDSTLLPSLRRQAARYGRRVQGRRAWVLLGDRGFDGHTVQPGDVIPPIRHYGKILSPERQARAELVAAARLDGVYGQRWKSETVHSVIKRKFGDTIRSRTLRLQRREAFMKGLIYDLHVDVSLPA